MKIGVCAGLTLAPDLKDSGIDYIELILAELAALSEEEFESAKQMLKTLPFPAETTNGFFPGTVKLCGDKFSEEEVRAYAMNALSRARELGIGICVLGSGGQRKIEDGADVAASYEQVKRAFTIVGDCAALFDITIAIEPLNRSETNVINTVARGADFVKELSHPNIRLLADIYHVAKENEPFSALAEHKDSLCHMHIATAEGRLFPLPGDGFDVGAVKAATDLAGYNGRISIEGEHVGDFAAYAKESVSYLKSVFA